MIRITVSSPAIETINYTDNKGNPAQLRKQTVWAHTVDSENVAGPFPEKVGVILGRDQANPYAPGEYTLHPSAFVVRDGKLLLNVRLTPARLREPSKTA